MKIIGTCLFDNTTEEFDSLKQASEKTLISPSHIKTCIDTGHKWKGWVFDVIGEDDD